MTRIRHDATVLAPSGQHEAGVPQPGIGLLTSTAMVAATSGDVTHFQDARHFASCFGLTPKEHSSGQHRKLGRIAYACLRNHAAYDEARPNGRLMRKKAERLSFAANA